MPTPTDELHAIAMAAKAEMPNPTDAMLADPLWEAIWQAIKSWDVNVPAHYNGYMGANGSHATLIYAALLDRLAALEARLEVVPGWSEDADGIACRNATIKMQDERLAALEADQRLYPAALIRLAEYAEMIAALEAERAAGEARVVKLCSFVFLAGHSEGWTGNQCRRDVQHVDAEKGWHLYVQNGALEKANARAANAKQEPGS